MGSQRASRRPALERIARSTNGQALERVTRSRGLYTHPFRPIQSNPQSAFRVRGRRRSLREWLTRQAKPWFARAGLSSCALGLRSPRARSAKFRCATSAGPGLGDRFCSTPGRLISDACAEPVAHFNFQRARRFRNRGDGGSHRQTYREPWPPRAIDGW